MKKHIKKILIILISLALLGTLSLLTINQVVKSSANNCIYTTDTISKKADCILVLGCGVRADGTPSKMLEDRLKTGIELYKKGVAPKIIMSGDHGKVTYDEVNLMKSYAMTNGVPSEDIFMDHAGFSTYESMYRARDIFQVDSLVIVTQEYHLYRAIYNAKSLGLDACGVSADLRSYPGQTSRDIREVLARCKDFAYCIFSPKPTYLGEAIPVSGNGNVTNDK